MSGFVLLFKFLECGVCIDLRGDQTLMPEQLLHAFQSGAMVEHRGGEGVSEHVGRAFLCRADPRDVFLHPVSYGCVIHPYAFFRHEQSFGMARYVLVSNLYIIENLLFKFLAEWDYALLAAFSGHLYLKVYEINGIVVELRQFREAHPRFIEHHDYRSGAYVYEFRHVPHRFIEQFLHL